MRISAISSPHPPHPPILTPYLSRFVRVYFLYLPLHSFEAKYITMFSRAFVAAALASTALAAGSHAGDGTFYDVGLGACGITSSADQMVVAVPDAMFQGYP